MERVRTTKVTRRGVTVLSEANARRCSRSVHRIVRTHETLPIIVETEPNG